MVWVLGALRLIAPVVGVVFVSCLQNRNPILLRFFSRYLDDRAPARFIVDIADHYSEATLLRLAQYGNVVERRAALMALGLTGSFECNRVFAKALADEDRGVRMLAEDSIHEIWARAGNARQQHQLLQVKRWNQGGHFEKAAEFTTEMCHVAPEFAEAWNQLGIAQFFLEQLEESIQSCWRALAVNPFHFEAALGMGHAYLELDEPLSALEFYQQAIELNPNLESIRLQVARMQRSFKRP